MYDYRFAAPESFSGNQQLVPQSDFYSLGCVLHQVVYGQPPFVADSPFELAKLHLDGHIASGSPTRGQWHDAFYGFLKWLLRRSPADRPRSCLDVLRTLTDLASLGLCEESALDRKPLTEMPREFDPGYSVVAVLDPGDSCETKAPPGEPSFLSTPTRPPDEMLSNDIENDDVTTPISRHDEMPPGYRIGGYQIVRIIGGGGMGVLYEARHLVLNRSVALKVMSQSSSQSADVTRRFLREMVAAAQLRHNHVVSVFDAGDANGTLYYAMELVDGEDLNRLVHRLGPLAVADASELIRQAPLAFRRHTQPVSFTVTLNLAI
jgi:serine/threonine protein kinase